MCVKLTGRVLPLKATSSSATGLNGAPAHAGEEFLETTPPFRTQTLQTHAQWMDSSREAISGSLLLPL